MVMMDFPGPDSVISDQLTAELSAELDALSEARQKAHASIQALILEYRNQSGISGLSELAAFEQPAIARFTHAHIERLKQTLGDIRANIKRYNIYSEDQSALLVRARDLEFEITTIGMS